MSSSPALYVQQQSIKGIDFDKNQPTVAVQFVKDGSDGALEPANYQEAFVVEFSSNIGDAKTNVASATGETPTTAEFKALVDAYNALATQFNSLISGLEKCGVLQRPNSAHQ